VKKDAYKSPVKFGARFVVVAAAFATLAAVAEVPTTTGADTSNSAGIYSHQTAPTQFVEVDGVRFAYRRFGKKSGIPLVFFQHFVGNMDNWDPAVIDGFATNREVILFDNAGVASSGGDVPPTVEGMAADAIDFLDAIKVRKADFLGFSLGSLVAQEVTVERPDLVRRLVLVGSGPRGGVGMATLTPEFQAILQKKHDNEGDLLLDVFFTQSASSQAAGRTFVARLNARKINRDPAVNDKVAPAQVAAFAAWGAPRPNSNAYLKAIEQPVLIVDGNHDIVHYPVNSFTLEENLPNAQLILYPDSNHGAQYQYPERFVADVSEFLNRTR
jgi:pimeloyl-ACP methyl ester carboxylesterase